MGYGARGWQCGLNLGIDLLWLTTNSTSACRSEFHREAAVRRNRTLTARKHAEYGDAVRRISHVL